MQVRASKETDKMHGDKLVMQNEGLLCELTARNVPGCPTEEYTRSSMFIASNIVSRCPRARLVSIIAGSGWFPLIYKAYS